MEKENGETGGGDGGGRESKGSDASSLLDAASLFGAYWGRDPSALLGGAYGGAGGAAGFSMLGGAGGGSGGAQGGGGGGRYPPNSTLSVAASQAASLGLHPAASAAWWSMASQLAAQDYLARLQASGLGGFPPGQDPYSLAAGLAAAQQQQQQQQAQAQQQRQGGARGRPAGQRGQQHRGQNKDKDKNMIPTSASSNSPYATNCGNVSLANMEGLLYYGSQYGLPKTSSPSMSSSLGMPSGLSSMAGLNSLAGSRTPTLSSASPQPLLSSSSSKHSRKSSSSAAAKASALSGAYLAGVSSKGNSPAPSQGQSAAAKEKEQLMMRGDLLMAQAYQQAVQGKNSSALFGNPFGLAGMNATGLSDKDRHSGLDSLANLPHTILSDGASILGGVRLPPDTEIIKYTSSIVGPKVPGTTNRGRKKTISLDPPHVSVLPALSSTGLQLERGGPAKRPKLDSDYGHLPMAHQNSSSAAASSASGSDRVEVIKLPSGASDPRSSTPFSMSGYTGLSKELLQSIANQSGLNLAALEKQFAEQFGGSSSYGRSSSQYPSYATNSTAPDTGLNLSSKPSQQSAQPHRDESPASTVNEDDAPLNLSLKPSTTSRSSEKDWKSSGRDGSSSRMRDHDETASALSSLSSITASLGARAQPQPPSRVSRRKPGAKPRRVIQESSPSPSQPQGQESPTPSGSEDSDMGPWHSTKEGRPRNLGRGVSKPKKNTVASLLAQSRALGIRPALAHQYLQEAADLLNPELQEKLKAAMGDMAAGLGGVMPAELSATDSDGALSDSGADDSDGSDALAAEPMLRLPLAMGWRRETLMKGLSKNGSIKGDVTYCPPEPHSNIKLKSIQELTNYLDKSPCPPLQKENFSFSSRPLIGRFLQVGGQEGMSETEVAKRLEEARRALGTAGGASSLAVEQRIELARQQQAAREARKDQAKGREQARLAREQERSERAEQARRDKEHRSLQLMEAQLRHADRNTKILNANEKTTIGFWKNIQAIASSSTSHRPISVSMPSMSLTLTPVSTQQHPANPPTQNQWKDYEYNALDKIKCFAESAAMNFSPTKSKLDAKKDFKLIPVKQEPKPNYKSNAVSVIKVTNPKVLKEDLNKIFDSYSRMGEFVSGQCDWTKESLDLVKVKTSVDDLKVLEEKYLSAKNNYMSSNLMLMPNLLSPHKPEADEVKATETIEVIDLVDNEDEDFAMMDSSSTEKVSPEKEMAAEALAARRKRQEDLEKQRQEDQSRKQQERELKRQQAVMLKEQLYMAEVGKQRELIYTVELERERRRQHMSLVKQLDGRRRYEDRERRKHRLLLDKLSLKEKKLEQRKKELELLKELRKPQEDSTLSDQKPLPTFNRIPGLKLPGQAMADIMMVFEFIHNFGMTLGFDMDTLPTLNTLQMSLLPDCCTDAEEELVSILTHLLVCAIEDPGIPHPGRHTTILGQTLRSNEITPANVSEVLRIYLYANATGEIKALTGINVERDREKRVADHHQSDAESLQSSCHGRNVVYYSHLHANPTWRLADKLRRRPYLALNPTSKARILALLCDELLQSKAVLRQIDASLESLSQMKKERYLMDAKLRKIKMMHSRKLRLENAEKQQALALERMQRMVEESEMAAVSAANSILNTPNSHMADGAMDISSTADIINSMDDKMLVNDVTGEITEKADDVNHDDVHEIDDSALMGAPPAGQYLKESAAKEALAIAKEQQHLDLVKANGAKDNTDKDSVAGDAELMLSDVESEGTQPEEDEDKNLPAEELARKLDKLIRQSDAQLQSLAAGAHSLRATCYGQDRYWRRYWSLGKCGGVYVEAMESSQPEIVAYHERVEEGARRKDEEEAACKAAGRRNTRNKKGQKAKAEESAQEVNNLAKNSEQLLQNELELRSIKSELNLGDHTRIIKYEPNMGHNKVQGSPIKMEEKHIQQQKMAEDHLLDIEDSIPTAFLVQKPQSEKRNVYAINDAEETTNTEIKLEPNIKMETNSDGILDLGIKSESKDGIITNNLEELKKLADSVVSPKENNTEVDVKLENIVPEKIKDETNDPEVAANMLTAKMAEGKWFSILRKENPLADSAHANGIDDSKDFKSLDGIVNQMNGGLNTSTLHANPVYTDNTQTCSEVIMSQGNRWDVCNNLNLLTNPSLLFSSNSGQTQTQAPVLNTFYHADCTLTMSGLDEEMMDEILNPKQEAVNELCEQINIENGLKDVSMNHLDSEPGLNLNSIENSDPEKTPVKCGAPKSKAASIASSTTTNGNMLGGVNSSNCQLGIAGMNLSALTSYVSCESPAPLQMTQEESEQLEYCKLNGLPKKLDGNYVPKDLRHGWWKVTDVDQLKDTLAKLHPRGVRERELHNSFLMGLVQTNNKLTIEKGDLLATELSISHLDRVIALNGGFPSPDSTNSFSVKTARRIDGSLLEQIEALEDRVAAASMQIKGWKPPPRTCPSPSSTPPRDGSEESGPAVARARLLQLEAAIERRYLRPPLGAGAPVPTQEASQQQQQQQQVQEEEDQQDARGATIPRGLATWREGTARCQTSAQLAMVLHALEAAIAWDKSIMKANCQFCQSGDSEDKLLLCDGCDKGYHTYCFKPKMEKIPDGDWYCYECLNKATGDRVCIVCGGKGGAGCPSGRGGRLVPCALCPRAYHQDCHYPPLSKVPRGKWYCVKCVTRAPPKKPRSAKKPKQAAQQDSLSDTMQPPSPAPSQASTTTTEDCPITSAMLNQSSLSSVQSTPEKHFQPGSNPATTDPGTGTTATTKQHFAAINNSLNSTINDNETTPIKNSELANDSMEYTESNDKDNIYNVDESGLSILDDSKNDTAAVAGVDDSCYDFKELEELSVDGESMLNNSQENNSIGKQQLRQQNNTSKAGSHSEDGGVDGEASCGTVEGDSNSGNNSEDFKGVGNEAMPASPREREGRHSTKKDRGSHKRLNKELALCKALLEEMEIHDDSWPFLLPVNTKQFPTYKKVIRAPMDLSTIKRKLQDCSYKTKEEFAGDVRQIFHNCEVFNEDESPVGRAGHGMRRFFEERWSNV